MFEASSSDDFTTVLYTAKPGAPPGSGRGAGEEAEAPSLSGAAQPGSFVDLLARMKNDADIPAYVVLMGDVGVGKSRVVEKMTLQQGLSGNSANFQTDTASIYLTYCGRFTLADTPGANPGEGAVSLKHSLCIAHAVNFRPVSLFLVVVKAACSSQEILENVQKYADSFARCRPMIGVCVTHMDATAIRWTEEELTRELKERTDICNVMFVGAHSAPSELLEALKVMAKGPPSEIIINPYNFFRHFEVASDNFETLDIISGIAEDFRAKLRRFKAALPAYGAKKQVDLVFQFQAYMKEQRVLCQKLLQESCNFIFAGDSLLEDLGNHERLMKHTSEVLQELQAMMEPHLASHGCDAPRKCPHCGVPWVILKVSGCNVTTCGNLPCSPDVRASEYMEFCNFAFSWDARQKALSIQENQPSVLRRREQQCFEVEYTRVKSKASVFCAQKTETVKQPGVSPCKLDELLMAPDVRTAVKELIARPAGSDSGNWMGCGRLLDWEEMAPVPLPPELTGATSHCGWLVGPADADDMEFVPEAAKLEWAEFFQESARSCKATLCKEALG